MLMMCLNSIESPFPYSEEEVLFVSPASMLNASEIYISFDLQQI